MTQHGETQFSGGDLFSSFQDLGAEEAARPKTREQRLDEIYNRVLNGGVKVDRVLPSMEEGAKAMAEVIRVFLRSIASELWDALVSMVTQAAKMATFKFAIELCAMGIKYLVEAMANQKIQPPNIDTQGVFYNIGQAASTPRANQGQPIPPAPAPQSSVISGSYRDPFMSPNW